MSAPFLSAALSNEFQYFLAGRHYAKRTLTSGNEGSSCVGEGKHFHKILIGEVLKTMLQNIIQNAGAEGISGTCSLNSMLLKEWCTFYTATLVLSTASVLTHSDQYKGNVVLLFNKGCTLVIVCSIEEKFYFVVRNLQHIAFGKTVLDLFSGIL